mmetsp:Transcript_109669/g.327826  ORF Transcript_109669/g.327826 Transcript_109669/m.327826 type:complete len:399 (-) Transcript_109669:34-1230(-)
MGLCFFHAHGDNCNHHVGWQGVLARGRCGHGAGGLRLLRDRTGQRRHAVGDPPLRTAGRLPAGGSNGHGGLRCVRAGSAPGELRSAVSGWLLRRRVHRTRAELPLRGDLAGAFGPAKGHRLGDGGRRARWRPRAWGNCPRQARAPPRVWRHLRDLHRHACSRCRAVDGCEVPQRHRSRPGRRRVCRNLSGPAFGQNLRSAALLGGDDGHGVSLLHNVPDHGAHSAGHAGELRPHLRRGDSRHDGPHDLHVRPCLRDRRPYLLFRAGAHHDCRLRGVLPRCHHPLCGHVPPLLLRGPRSPRRGLEFPIPRGHGPANQHVQAGRGPQGAGAVRRPRVHGVGNRGPGVRLHHRERGLGCDAAHLHGPRPSDCHGRSGAPLCRVPGQAEGCRCGFSRLKDFL